MAGFAFEGRPVPVRPGQSVAAALVAAGLRDWRDTRRSGGRGLFCGMGVCQDCLVEVDGRANQRACMTMAEGVTVVRRQPFPGTVSAPGPSLPPIGSDDLPVATPDILIIGGGAGGLAAAAATRGLGLEVVLLDERAKTGGQYYKQSAAGAPPLDRQQAEGAALAARVLAAGVRIVTGAEVWGAFAPLEIAVASGGATRLYRPRRLIVATGAYERGVPLPGWTLPGVMTTGAAQTLLRSHGTLAGRRVLVAGNGPLNLQVALELARAGVEVAAVAELARPGLATAGALWRMARGAPGLLGRGAGLVAGLGRRRVPLLWGHALLGVERRGEGLAARLGRRVGTGFVAGPAYAVDAVCLGYGFLPSNEVLRALGCRHDYDPVLGQLVTVRDGDCRTSLPEVWGVGDCCGLGGAPAAVEEGRIAALTAAASLGVRLSGGQRAELDRARARLLRQRAFQVGLWQLFAAPRLQGELATAETLVCRCEEVTLDEVEAALGDGQPSLGEVKRRTRVGMGRCQGRYCAPVVAAMLAARQGRTVDERALFAPRAPVKPVTIAEIARAAERL